MATLAARAEGAAQQRPDQRQAQAAHDIRPLLVLAGVISAGLATVVAYALPFLASGQGLSVATVGLMGAGASLMLGGLLGFLFGIPRTLQGERPADDDERAALFGLTKALHEGNHLANPAFAGAICRWSSPFTVSEAFRPVVNGRSP